MRSLMLMLFTLKLIDGIIKRVAKIRYSNGVTVERVYPIVGNVPEDVRVVENAKNTEDYNPHTPNHIVNQEYLQYQYHFGQ